MPSAKRRNFNTEPASREVLDRHNKHSKETWPEVKHKILREQRIKEPLRYMEGQ
jgi:hypothetical protein